ncbi:hypothetical protein KAR48_05370 [bacterium]|nr:hypothetical protein [bacterium]
MKYAFEKQTQDIFSGVEFKLAPLFEISNVTQDNIIRLFLSFDWEANPDIKKRQCVKFNIEPLNWNTAKPITSNLGVVYGNDVRQSVTKVVLFEPTLQNNQGAQNGVEIIDFQVVITEGTGTVSNLYMDVEVVNLETVG